MERNITIFMWPTFVAIVKESSVSAPEGEDIGIMGVLPDTLRMIADRIVRTADGQVWMLDPSYQSLRCQDDDVWTDLDGWYSFRTRDAGDPWKFGADIDRSVMTVEIIEPSPVAPDMGRAMTAAEVEEFCRASAMAD